MPLRRHALNAFALSLTLAACGALPGAPQPPAGAAMSTASTRQATPGHWASLATEVRPSAQKNADGSAKPFYLKRDFTALADDRFTLVITNFADPQGQVPLVRIALRGHLHWRGEHPVAPGAQKVDFVADEAYEVTPLLPGFADVLNQVAAQGYARWQVGQTQSVFGQNFAPFGLKAGVNFMEYDLVYVRGDLMFWGARHPDGRGFDTEANRPTSLQIPMQKI